MAIPIATVVPSSTVPYPAIRRAGIAVAAFPVLFDIAGLPHPGLSDDAPIAGVFVLDGPAVWISWTRTQA